MNDLVAAAGEDGSLAAPLASLLAENWLSDARHEGSEDDGPNVYDPSTGYREFGFIVKFYPHAYTPAWLNPLREAASLEVKPLPFHFGADSITIDGNTRNRLDSDFVKIFRRLYEAGGEWVRREDILNLLGFEKTERIDRLIRNKGGDLSKKYIESRSGRPGGYRFLDPNVDGFRPRSSVESNSCER